MLQKKMFGPLVRCFTILGITALSNTSLAVFIIEPSLGYRQETIIATDLLQNETQIKITDPVYGLKMGFTNGLGISFDLAGSLSQGNAEMTPSVQEKPEYTHTMGSAQVGVNAMGILKIYLGYSLMDELEIKTNTSIQGYKLKGQGFQAGLMTFPLPRLGLGIQYNVHQFKEITGAAYTNGSELKNYYDKLDVQDISANFSFLF
jgi:hypothetical protein